MCLHKHAEMLRAQGMKHRASRGDCLLCKKWFNTLHDYIHTGSYQCLWLSAIKQIPTRLCAKIWKCVTNRFDSHIKMHHNELYYIEPMTSKCGKDIVFCESLYFDLDNVSMRILGEGWADKWVFWALCCRQSVWGKMQHHIDEQMVVFYECHNMLVCTKNISKASQLLCPDLIL